MGANPTQTVSPGAPPATYTWYGGKVTRGNAGKPVYTPMEYGAISLAPTDPVMQDNFGLIGGLIIEPQGSTWQTDDNSRLSGTVTKPDKTSFRESVVMIQDDLAALRTSNSTTMTNGTIPPTEPAPDGFSQAVNYRTEPMPYRYANPNYLQNDPALSPTGVARAGSNTLVSTDPQTPVLPAEAGKPLRLRMLHPAGLNEQVFELHGHNWQEEPYSTGSTKIVDKNPLSQWTGSRDTFGPNSSFDVVLSHAGGKNAVQGDYLFRTFIGSDFLNGMWGLVRVGPPGKDVVTITEYCVPPSSGVTQFTVAGVNTVNPATHHMSKVVTISGPGLPAIPPIAVDPMAGTWSFQSSSITTAPASLTVTSQQGGTVTVSAKSCPILGNQTTAPAAVTKHKQRIVESDRFRAQPTVEMAPPKK
jgi:manganese oxidase